MGTVTASASLTLRSSQGHAINYSTSRLTGWRSQEVGEPSQQVGKLHQERGYQSKEFRFGDNFLVEQRQASKEIVVHLWISQRLAHLVEEGGVGDGALARRFREAYIPTIRLRSLSRRCSTSVVSG